MRAKFMANEGGKIGLEQVKAKLREFVEEGIKGYEEG